MRKHRSCNRRHHRAMQSAADQQDSFLLHPTILHHPTTQFTHPTHVQETFLGGAVVRRLTHDRKVAGSTPGRGAIKSTMSSQPSIPPG